MIRKFKSNKAFTIIELLVVIAVIAILVLLAAPKLLGYIEDARIAHIKSDIKVNESIIQVSRDENEKLFEDWEVVEKVKLEEYRDSKSLFNKKGLIKPTYEFDDEIFKIPSSKVNSNLKGGFYVNKDGNILYHNKNLPGNNESVETPEDIAALCEKHLATDDDFELIPNGLYIYTGQASIVCIPDEINGETLTSNKYMFDSTTVTHVMSTNANVTDMSNMFAEVESDMLDISGLNTAGVTDMSNMFNSAKVSELKLGDFDVSLVSDMSRMFNSAHLDTVDFSGSVFPNLTATSRMFTGAVIVNEIDFSNVTFSGATSLSDMFWSVEAGSITFAGSDLTGVSDMTNFIFASTVGGIIDFSGVIMAGSASDPLDMERAFGNSKSKSVSFVGADISHIKSMEYMFFVYEADSIDFTDAIIRGSLTDSLNMKGMFGNSSVKNISLSGATFTEVATMESMFFANRVTDSIDFTGTTITGAEGFTMKSMFSNSTYGTVTFANAQVTGVTAMNSLFFSSKVTDLDLSGIDTSHVTDMSNMFSNTRVAVLDLSSFDISLAHNTMNGSSDSRGTSGMVSGSSDDGGIKMGYARTAQDAEYLNASLGKQEGLVFTVK